MDLHRHRTSVDAADAGAIEVSLRPTDRGFSWRIANTGREPVSVRSVTAVHTISGLAGRLRFFRNGYQSSSETSIATLGSDVDPATVPGALELHSATHHSDPRGGHPERLRSEMVTVLVDERSAAVAGFLGGDLHDGVVAVGPGQTGQELRMEAFLGDAVLAAGEERDLHEAWVHPVDDPLAALEVWAQEYGRRSLARTRSRYQVGWCSRHHYFDNVTELDVRQNLAAISEWPIEVFRIDDGYQSAVGDWLTTNRRFPSGLGALPPAISATGCRPGLWIAPFLVGPDSVLAVEHPDWIARHRDGGPLNATYNQHWGGFAHTLDTSHPAVQDHLASLAAALVDLGFSHLELGLLFAAGMEGVFHDPSLTPAQRVRAGCDAIRRGAGEHTFLLGSGAPLGSTVGVVDGMRIGPDVAPWWTPRAELWHVPGYMSTIASVANAWRNAMGRAFMHRRLWLNDPGCLILRHEDSDLTPQQVRAWAMLVASSGGMVTVSDELSLLDVEARELFEAVLAVGRRADAAAVGGDVPRCDDLLDNALPGRLRGEGVRFEGDPRVGFARVVTL